MNNALIHEDWHKALTCNAQNFILKNKTKQNHKELVWYLLTKGPQWGESTFGRGENICILSTAEKAGLPWPCYTVLCTTKEENTPPQPCLSELACATGRSVQP